jgi:hypothetical protein
VVPLDEAPKVLDAWSEQPSRIKKIVITLD